MIDRVVPSQQTDPSLVALLSEVPSAQQFSQPAEVLIILGNQLEQLVRQRHIAAHLAVGTLRFSLFRLHQEQLIQLTSVCASITVFGEADSAAPDIAGITFVTLPIGSPLSQEWFVVVDSPQFWGALLTRAVPSQTSGASRRYLFAGAFTAEARIVSRALLQLNLLRGAAEPAIGPRDLLSQRGCWGEIIAQLTAHPDAGRLDLQHVLGAQIELLAVAEQRNAPLEQMLADAVEVVAADEGAAGVILYQRVGASWQPVLSRGAKLMPLVGSGLVARAAHHGQPAYGSLQDEPEGQALSAASAAIALPIMVRGHVWGVLLAGVFEDDVATTSIAYTGAGIVGVLGQCIAAGDPTSIKPVAAAPLPHTPAPAPAEESPPMNEAAEFETAAETDESVVDGQTRLKQFLAAFSMNCSMPLQTVRDLINQLPTAGPLNEQQAALVGQLARLNNKMLLLMNELAVLGETRLAQPQGYIPLQLDLLVEAAVNTLYAEIGRRGQHVQFQVATQIPYVVGSEEGLWRVVTALLDNAIKYSPTGGRITITIAAEFAKVIVTVTDTGHPLAANELAQVFDAFYRAPNALKLDAAGRGLGLTIAKGIIKQHEGTDVGHKYGGWQ